MTATHKCMWTGQQDSRTIAISLLTVDRVGKPVEKTAYVLPEHEQALRRSNRSFANHGRLFFRVMMILVFTSLLTAILSIFAPVSDDLLLSFMGICLALAGGLFIVFPFASHETIDWLGTRKASLLSRSLGVAIAVVGIVILAYANHLIW
ncbi:MAG: hypothetical protein JJU10_09335 [Idiomarina sp.]|nr:hypothetical protein [Idiomarina sp.]